jgi:hypothetical protein
VTAFPGVAPRVLALTQEVFGQGFERAFEPGGELHFAA